MNAFSYIRFGALIAAVTVLTPGEDGNAQVSPYMDFNLPSVTVDLSVIDDGGYGPGGGGSPTSTLGRPQQGKLLIPGARAPMSMLHVPPPGRAVSSSSRSVAVPKPAPVRKMKSVAKVAPAPAPAPAPKSTIALTAPAVPKKPLISSAATAPKPSPKPVKTAMAPKKLKAPAPAPVAAPTAPPAPVMPKAPKVTSAATAPQAPTKVSTPKNQTTEKASLPPAGSKIETGLAMQIVFANDATRLPAEEKNKLKSLTAKLAKQEGLRLQLMAYAGGDRQSASLARRLSLSRALSVRSFLIENGIRSTRIDVRALGNKTTTEPLNRVDLNITER